LLAASAEAATAGAKDREADDTPAAAAYEGEAEADGMDPFDDLDMYLDAEADMMPGGDEGRPRAVGGADAPGNCDALGTGLTSCRRCVGSVPNRTAALAEAEASTAAAASPVADRREQALLELRAAFGTQLWDMVSLSHRLSYAAPLLYCRCCGAHGASPQYLVGLKGECLPSLARTKAMLRQLERGLHPTTKAALAVPVPLHDLTREEEAAQLGRGRRGEREEHGRRTRRRR
jgi:hypothetical protein